MLIVALEGGLGNQMFQYAFYLALKEHYSNVKVKLDISFIDSKKHNGFELKSIFDVDTDFCDVKDVVSKVEDCPKSIPMHTMYNLWFAVRRRVMGRKESFVLQEDATEYYENFFELDINRDYYFKGVWANYRYFDRYKELVKKTFVFPAIRDKQNLIWKEKIENSNSVSVHFRGGDYYKEGFSILGKSYYQKAFELLLEFDSDLTFFVFTDDVENAKKNIPQIKNNYYITNNKGEKSCIDMQLMSLCNHNIMANSTFSFWGAYLNMNEKKVVIGSKKTVGGNSQSYYFENVILI